MISGGDVGELLARALAALPSDELGGAADALNDEVKPAVYAVAVDSTDPELIEGYQQLDRASDEITTALQACKAAREHILTYLAGIGWMRHGDSPPSLPHPSTTPRVPGDAAGYLSWVEQARERLPPYGVGRPPG